MRFGDSPESEHIEDRTGQSGGGMSLGGGGGMLGLLLPIVASRFGIVGILVLALGYCVFSGGLGGLISGGGGGGTGQSTLPPEQKKFMGQVLGSTEQVWGQIFQQAGSQYRPRAPESARSLPPGTCRPATSRDGSRQP